MVLKQLILNICKAVKASYLVILGHYEEEIASYRVVQGILMNYTRKENIFIADSRYKLTSADKMLSISKVIPFRFRKYEKEIYDCDDFTFSFLGVARFIVPNFAIGFLWTHTHALNFFIDSKLDVWLIEPQTGAILPPSTLDSDIRLMVI